ncbi:hypothetical protein J4E83_004936 [Alternaria metachromatica]|uniref:uncharacterized protein n=1 Tax=Alternaria metachromatica TaxID=283354 RepID=UPI0020C36B36|nr:uncharacterized protein J4E83_004936 [Alternaria metachromatica]KAI4622196.1 hypothetical protein J4E83_004936 [Alternaria metachromatica]
MDKEAKPVADPVKLKQEGEILLADSMKSERAVADYLSSLGLAADERVGGKHRLLDPKAEELYEGVTKAVINSTLPKDLPNLRKAYEDPECFKEEAQSLMSRYGSIWGDDDRRSATNELRISQPDDKATIEIMLRCLIGKRLFTSRKDTLRKVRKQERSLSNAPLPKPFIRGPSSNSAPEDVALSTVTNSYGGDDNPSDDSESYGFIKQESSPTLSPDIRTISDVPAYNGTTLGGTLGDQDDAEIDTLPLEERRLKKADKQEENSSLTTTTPDTDCPPYTRWDELSATKTSGINCSGLTPSMEDGRQVESSDDTSLIDRFKDMALQPEQNIATHAQLHEDQIGDSSMDSKPKEESLHQQAAFDELVEVLKTSTPQGSKTRKLEFIRCKLSTTATLKRMKRELGTTIFMESYTSMLLWHKIHAKLQDFQMATSYHGKAGADWRAHKQTLRASSWKDASLPALSAHRELGLFVQELEGRREWVAFRPDVFATRVACFYATLLQQPNIGAADLVAGFQEYNVELLKWFEVGD